MSEKKPAVQQGKASKKSAGERRSGGTVHALNFSALEHELLNKTKPNGHTRKALALVRRAARNAGAAHAFLGKM